MVVQRSYIKGHSFSIRVYVSITGHIEEHEEELVAERQARAKAERQKSDF